MAKPRLYLRNRPNPEGPGDGDNEEGGVVTYQGKGGEGGGEKGMERAAHDTPTRRSHSRHREGQLASAEKEEAPEEQDPEGVEEGEEEDRESAIPLSRCNLSL